MVDAKTRKTKRKLSPGLKAWNEKVMRHFNAGRSKKGKKYTLKMAMVAAKAEKK
jgi:hypothetical protein